MKRFEEKIIKRQECVQRICDICGKESNVDSETSWDRGSWDVDDTIISIKVEHREGYSSSDGGSGERYDIDICPDCFKKELTPFLKTKCKNIKLEDWIW